MDPSRYRIASLVAIGHLILILLVWVFGVGSIVPPTPMPIQAQLISAPGSVAQPQIQKSTQPVSPQTATKSGAKSDTKLESRASAPSPVAVPAKSRTSETLPVPQQSLSSAGPTTADSKAGGSAGAVIGPSAVGASAASATTSGSAVVGASGDSGPRVDASFKGNRLPDYPAMSRRLGEQGVVELRVFITPEGRAADVQLVKSSGSARLDRSAMDSIREWRFLPARQSGRPVGAWYEWRWEFRLDG